MDSKYTQQLQRIWKKVMAWPWRRIRLVLRAALLLLGPLLTVLACQAISLQGGGEAVAWMGSHGSSVGVTWLILVLVEMALFGLIRLGSLSYFLTAVFPLGLTLVSYYKTIINGEPLMLTDFSLAGNIANVAGFAMDRITVSPATGMALSWVLALTAVLVVLDVLILRHPDAWRLDFRRGAALCGGSLLVLAAAFAGGLEGFCVAQYEAYPMQADRDAGCGVSLSLLSTLIGSQAKGSESYSELRMQQILQEMEADQAEQAAEQGTAQKPHIIFVMNESFFDVTRLPNVTFSQDPLANYHRLERESTYGQFYTITCGGGTGWVEMETFTGVSTEELAGGTANTELTAAEYGALPSYVRVLDENGYETIAFHAHTSELYNRDKNYPHIGFDQVLFYEEFQEDATYAGGYFDDDSTADVIISLFEEYRDTPTYIYAMTMQNHQPYYAGRYDPERLAVESDCLTQEDLEVLNCYVSGLYDADQMLGKLVDYFSGELPGHALHRLYDLDKLLRRRGGAGQQRTHDGRYDFGSRRGGKYAVLCLAGSHRADPVGVPLRDSHRGAGRGTGGGGRPGNCGLPLRLWGCDLRHPLWGAIYCRQSEPGGRIAHLVFVCSFCIYSMPMRAEGYQAEMIQ